MGAWLVGLAAFWGMPEGSRDEGASARSAYETARDAAGRDAAGQVDLALWCETQGLAAERAKHLARAVLLDREHAAARGLLGLVAFQGRWMAPETLADRLNGDEERVRTLAEYNARRDRMTEDAEGHWKLALWCESQGLEPEAKAHLSAVVRLEPGRDAAWKRLGFRKHKGRWLTDAQLAGETEERQAQQAADRLWKPRLLEWKRDQADPGKADAIPWDEAIADPRSVPSIWRVFGVGAPVDQDRAIGLFGRIDGPSASRALAALAIYSDSSEIRRRASEVLRRRDPRDFLDTLIGLFAKPVRYEARIATLVTPGYFRVEGKDHDLERIFTIDEHLTPQFLPYSLRNLAAVNNPGAVISAEMPFNPLLQPFDGTTTIARPRAGSGGAGFLNRQDPLGLRSAAYYVGDLNRRLDVQNSRIQASVAEVEAANARIQTVNENTEAALHAITGADPGDGPAAWEAWWTDQRGFSYGQRSRSEPENQPRVVLTEWIHFSCFAAGTPVRTIDGIRPIDSLKVGDQVLAQDVRTGLLSPQPVVAVYHNAPSATLRLSFSGASEPIVATGIHRFWKAGQGWVMSRDLKPGDPVRTLGGTAKLVAVEPGPSEPVFNLEVASGHTFLVGEAGFLVHDNSLARPVPTPFDAVKLANGR